MKLFPRLKRGVNQTDFYFFSIVFETLLRMIFGKTTTTKCMNHDMSIKIKRGIKNWVILCFWVQQCSMLLCAFLIPFTCCVWLTVENALSFFPSKTKWNFCVVRKKDQYLMLWVTLKDWGKKWSCKKSKESFLHKVIQFYKMVCCVVGNWVKLFFMNHKCIIV